MSFLNPADTECPCCHDSRGVSPISGDHHYCTSCDHDFDADPETGEILDEGEIDPTCTHGAEEEAPALARPSVEDLVAAIGIPFAEWHHQCHAISLAIVRSGAVEGRVVRGHCRGVGPHSWIARGLNPGDVYDENTEILDPTLWSWREDVEGVWYGNLAHGWHVPAGAGRLLGTPMHGGGEEIDLGLDHPYLDAARAMGPLDRVWWHRFLTGPLQGVAAGEIILAASRDRRVSALVPIDVLGNMTNANPSGLYLREVTA